MRNALRKDTPAPDPQTGGPKTDRRKFVFGRDGAQRSAQGPAITATAGPAREKDNSVESREGKEDEQCQEAEKGARQFTAFANSLTPRRPVKTPGDAAGIRVAPNTIDARAQQSWIQTFGAKASPQIEKGRLSVRSRVLLFKPSFGLFPLVFWSMFRGLSMPQAHRPAEECTAPRSLTAESARIK